MMTSPGSTASSAVAVVPRKRWRDRSITNLRGTIGAVIVVAGFLGSLQLINQEAQARDAADCRSLNDRTRFGLMSRQDDVEHATERVAELEEQIDQPFDPTDFPGYANLDESTQVFVQGLIASSREEALVELATAREDAVNVQADLELYTDSIPLLDCNGNDDIDDGDFTGR